jgi:hypothetical protein
MQRWRANEVKIDEPIRSHDDIGGGEMKYPIGYTFVLVFKSLLVWLVWLFS